MGERSREARLIDQALFGPSADLAHDLAAIEGFFGVLRENELDIDRADGQRRVPLRRISQL